MEKPNKEMKEFAERLLCMKKNQYARFDFKTFGKVLGNICFIAEYNRTAKDDEKDIVERMTEGIIDGAMEQAVKLPAYILATVENKREFCLGYMSEETKNLLKVYVESFEE